MHRRARVLVALAVVAVALAGLPGVASAQVVGECDITFNGVAVDRIDTLGSPLELDTEDVLIFSGVDPAGTALAEVVMMIGPVALDSGIAAYDRAQEEFTATIDVAEVAAFGVGLYRIHGSTVNCSADAWLRVSGRFPLATLIGLLGMGLMVGGITGQLGAVASRHRFARSAAALGGLATGPGIALIGQQFGRLQVSLPSMLAVTVVAAGLGLLAAIFWSPALREKRRARRRGPGETSGTVATGPGASIEPESDPEPSPQLAGKGDTTVMAVAPPQPAVASAPYWCYVMAATDVFDLIDHTTTVASLEPGNWYLAKRTLSGWVHVVADDGTEGWVAEGAVHRQG